MSFFLTNKKLEELRKISYDSYEKYLYGGKLSSFVMGVSHQLLERGILHFDNDHVLEICGANSCHYKWIKSPVSKYVVIDHSLPMEAQKIKEVEYLLCDSVWKPLDFEDNFFSRVIASHLWEHVSDPEKYLLDWYRVLRPGGVISIALPCDPGFLWQLGKEINVGRWLKLTKLMREDYDYINAHEHVNSIYNLEAILRFHFKKNLVIHKWPCSFLPIWMNLFYIVSIRKI